MADTKVKQVRTIRNIEKGEELVASYLDDHMFRWDCYSLDSSSLKGVQISKIVVEGGPKNVSKRGVQKFENRIFCNVEEGEEPLAS